MASGGCWRHTAPGRRARTGGLQASWVASEGAQSAGRELTTERQVEIWMGNPKLCYHRRDQVFENRQALRFLCAFTEHFL